MREMKYLKEFLHLKTEFATRSGLDRQFIVLSLVTNNFLKIFPE